MIEHDGKEYDPMSEEGRRLRDWRLREQWDRPIKYILDDLTAYTQDVYYQQDQKEITMLRAIHAILELNVKINRKLRKLLKEGDH